MSLCNNQYSGAKSARLRGVLFSLLFLFGLLFGGGIVTSSALADSPRERLTEGDLSGPAVQIQFTGCDDEGWYFVNGQYVGETHDWDAKPAFDITKFLRPGDNVIAVCCRNGGALGGLNPNVAADIIGKPSPAPWPRSLFNGLAQVVVQSTKDAGEIKLTATADGLAPATTLVNTQPATPHPCVP